MVFPFSIIFFFKFGFLKFNIQGYKNFVIHMVACRPDNFINRMWPLHLKVNVKNVHLAWNFDYRHLFCSS